MMMEIDVFIFIFWLGISSRLIMKIVCGMCGGWDIVLVIG